MNKSKKQITGRGGSGRGQGRRPSPVGTITMDCMPMMADVVSAAVPRPVEISAGVDPTKWMKKTPAWPRIIKQVRASRVQILARRGEKSEDSAITEIRRVIGDFDAVVILLGGGVYVAFNADGTRAAMSDNPAITRL